MIVTFFFSLFKFQIGAAVMNMGHLSTLHSFYNSDITKVTKKQSE